MLSADRPRAQFTNALNSEICSAALLDHTTDELFGAFFATGRESRLNERGQLGHGRKRDGDRDNRRRHRFGPTFHVHREQQERRQRESSPGRRIECAGLEGGLLCREGAWVVLTHYGVTRMSRLNSTTLLAGLLIGGSIGLAAGLLYTSETGRDLMPFRRWRNLRARQPHLDEVLDESFPASDPPSWTPATTAPVV